MDYITQEDMKRREPVSYVAALQSIPLLDERSAGGLSLGSAAPLRKCAYKGAHPGFATTRPTAVVFLSKELWVYRSLGRNFQGHQGKKETLNPCMAFRQVRKRIGSYFASFLSFTEFTPDDPTCIRSK